MTTRISGRGASGGARTLRSSVVALGLAGVSLTESLSADLESRPHRQVEPLPLASVEWTGGFWEQRFSTCRDHMIPVMWDLMKGTQYKPFLEHFRIAAGLAQGRYRGAKWNDGDFYKWLEAVCATQAIHHDPAWEKRLDEIIEIIGKAQREDGYLHTPVLIGARNGDPQSKPFADRFNFEMYNMGHLMTTACVHHQVTGKDNFLRIARKAADFLDGAFAHPTPEQARHAICPSHYMGIIDLYRITGERRYLDLAERLIRMRDLVEDGGDDNQDRLPLAEHREAVGHAVRANYLYAGVADLYAERGDPALWKLLQVVWQNLVEKKMYITGGCGALYDGASPDGSKDQGSITRIHQAYGRNYQLPNVTAHNETCANIGNVLWNWRMFLASGEARYIDVAELALYNSVLSGVDLKGRDYFYTNPLRQLDTAPVDLRWSRTRVPFVTSFCCPPNVVRTVASVGGYAYATSEDAIWVNLYGSNSLATTLGDGEAVRLEQESQYPWEGEIHVTVAKCGSKPFALKLRIPGWTPAATLTLNGDPVALEASPGSYVALKRSWKAGDTLKLTLEMAPRLMEAHPLVEETRNQVAIQRGPMVYCLESVDLPVGTQLSEVRVPNNLGLVPSFEPDLLQGVSVLRGELVARKAGDWKGQLYRTFREGTAEKIKVSFIPYYAWSNRGPSEMTVWIPRD